MLRPLIARLGWPSLLALILTAAPASAQNYYWNQTAGGTGNWVLTGTNTYSGSTLVDAGTLRITNTAALGFGGPVRLGTVGGTTVTDGATLDLNGTCLLYTSPSPRD